MRKKEEKIPWWGKIMLMLACLAEFTVVFIGTSIYLEKNEIERNCSGTGVVQSIVKSDRYFNLNLSENFKKHYLIEKIRIYEIKRTDGKNVYVYITFWSKTSGTLNTFVFDKIKIGDAVYYKADHTTYRDIRYAYAYKLFSMN